MGVCFPKGGTMKRIPNNILPKFEEKTGIPARYISAYLGDGPVNPGRERCRVLAKASRELGYDFSESDWMFNPEKIKQALLNQDTQEQPA